MPTANAETAAAARKDVLDVRTVAAMLDVSERTVLNWIKLGRLPRPFRAGKVIRWKRGTIEALFAGQESA